MLALQNYLSTTTDKGILVLRDYVSKAVELFKLIIDNLVKFKDKVDDIIILYYKFIERVYVVLKEYYKDKQEKEPAPIIRTEVSKVVEDKQRMYAVTSGGVGQNV